MPARARELLLVSVVALALTIVFTWPTAARFGSAGRLDNGDARFSIWNVSWVAHALTSDPRNLWNANIFYPQKGALAYSEANLVAGVIGVPVWVLTRNPYATSNFTIMMSFVLAALAMYALVRYLTGNRWGAALAGLVYAFSSYAFAHMGHIQLLMTFAPAWALLRMHRFVDAPSVPTALWLGVSLVVQALACGYYGLYGGLAVALGIVWFGAWSRRWRSPRFWLLTALSAVIAAGLTAPFLVPYVELQHGGFSRTLADLRIFSATWRDFLVSPQLMSLWMLPIVERLGGWHEVLFPGGLTLIFAAVTLVYAARRSTSLAASERVVGFYVLLAGLAAWSSLGPDAGLYRWIFETVPFMSMLRAPARFGMLVTLALAVLAGAGLATLERGWTGRRRNAWLAAIALVGLASSGVGPLQLEAAPPESRALVAMRNLPHGAVAEFPFFTRRKDLHQHTLYMVASTFHWHPLVNGYSDYLPPAVEAAMPALAEFPSPDALRFLRERGTRYVLVHWNLYSQTELAPLRLKIGELQGTLRPMLNDADTSLYELMPAAGGGW